MLLGKDFSLAFVCLKCTQKKKSKANTKRECWKVGWLAGKWYGRLWSWKMVWEVMKGNFDGWVEHRWEESFFFFFSPGVGGFGLYLQKKNQNKRKVLILENYDWTNWEDTTTTKFFSQVLGDQLRRWETINLSKLIQ